MNCKNQSVIAAGHSQLLLAAQAAYEYLSSKISVADADYGVVTGLAAAISDVLDGNAAPPAVDLSDTALLDAMERERIAVIPEFEGPWDAQIFGEDEAALACGSGVTPRKAIAEAMASLEARKAHDVAQAAKGSP